MSANEIFNQMLSAYDLTTEQKKRNAKEVAIWSNEYFLQLAQMIRFE